MSNAAPTLRPYQHDALQAISAGRASGALRMLVQMPTGTGKTVMFAESLKHHAPWLKTLRTRGARLLVIAHREELLDQAMEKIQRANPGLVVTIEQGQRVAHKYSDVVVASIQTLAASGYRRLLRLMDSHSFNITIVDEAHHAAATTYRGVLAHLGFLPADVTNGDAPNIEEATEDEARRATLALHGWDAQAPKDRLLIGVTATPNRSDAVGLGCVFQSIAYSYALKKAIDDKWLVPLLSWVVDTDLSLEAVKISHGDFNQKQLAEAVNVSARNKLALAAWQEHADNLSTIAFTVDVAHAHACAELWQQAGYNAKALSGETPKEERRQMLRDYTAGKVVAIFNCMVLTEGTDLPNTKCILHLKPTKSATLYEQMTGRGLRLFPGKNECIIIDLVDLSRRHSLMSSPVLYGLPPTVVVKGQRLNVVEDEYAELLGTFKNLDVAKFGRMTLRELRAKAELVDVWAVPDLGAFGRGRAMDWMKLGPELYQLLYPWNGGTEALQVRPNLIGQWEVAATFHVKETDVTTHRVIATALPTSDAAAGIAEAYVLQERRAVTTLMDTSAKWRGQPATEKQIKMLRWKRIPVRHGLTSGEASQLIDLAMAKGKARV